MSQPPMSIPRIAVLGCGFMGTALLKGLLENDFLTPNNPSFEYSACVRSASSLDRLKKDLGHYQDKVDLGYGNAGQMAHGADIVLLGIEPAGLSDFLKEDGMIRNLEHKVIISLLAGVSSAQLMEALTGSGIAAAKFYIARVIPTLGATIGESVTLVADFQQANEDQRNAELLDDIFNRLGGVQHVPERLMNEATAVGAVCHALAIVAVDTVTDAAVADGIPRAASQALAAQCLRSASGLLLNGFTPESLKAAMSTPSGITINSMINLDAGVRPGLARTVREAVAYTKSMS